MSIGIDEPEYWVTLAKVFAVTFLVVAALQVAGVVERPEPPTPCEIAAAESPGFVRCPSATLPPQLGPSLPK